MQAHSFTSNKYGCPYCRKSYVEKQISSFLENNNIQFISEMRFSNCCDKSILPFDFYLPLYNLLIEYDGEFHYKNIIGEDALLTCKLHNSIKTEFANNNIHLLRIPYWNFKDFKNIILNTINDIS